MKIATLIAIVLALALVAACNAQQTERMLTPAPRTAEIHNGRPCDSSVSGATNTVVHQAAAGSEVQVTWSGDSANGNYVLYMVPTSVVSDAQGTNVENNERSEFILLASLSHNVGGTPRLQAVVNLPYDVVGAYTLQFRWSGYRSCADYILTAAPLPNGAPAGAYWGSDGTLYNSQGNEIALNDDGTIPKSYNTIIMASVGGVVGLIAIIGAVKGISWYRRRNGGWGTAASEVDLYGNKKKPQLANTSYNQGGNFNQQQGGNYNQQGGGNYASQGGGNYGQDNYSSQGGNYGGNYASQDSYASQGGNYGNY